MHSYRRNIRGSSNSMSSSTTDAIVFYLLLLSSSSQSSGFLSPDRTERKSTIMNEGSSSTLFPPNSKFHPNQNGLSKRRRWLVVDFDGTCTEHDTTPLLPRLAAFATRSRSSISQSAGAGKDDTLSSTTNGRKGYNHQQDLQKRLDLFQLLEDEFMKRYGEARANMFSNDDDQSTTLYDVLDALDEPSCIVTEMVSASGCLSGLGHADTKEVEGMLNLHGVTETDNDTRERMLENHSDDKVVVRLRHGCESTLARILLDDESNSNEDAHTCLGWSLAILSINWCPALIDASVVQPVLRRRRSLLSIKSCDTEVPIWSNEVDRDGVVTLHVPGALAKRDRILELKRYIKQDCDQTQSIIIYVGDSSTDLAGLLAADVGIFMGNSSSLIQIAKSWGVEIAPLKHRNEHGFQSLVELDTSDENESDERKILWQVDTWQEIDEALQQIDELWKQT